MTTLEVQSEKFKRGVATRKAVLGADYVEKSLAAADDFTWPMQQLATEYCWDEIWNRPGLDRRSRSLLNLGMISALNRPHELRLHVRGALNNGITESELREVFLQVAIYCGLPAALDSLRIAKDVLNEVKTGS
jgi:4-carboxymuconolactone decarboxylase